MADTLRARWPKPGTVSPIGTQHLQSVRRAGNYHKTIATYMTALTDHGLSVEVFAEPRPNQKVAAENPHRGALPPFLLIRAARRVTNVARHHI
jgi:hypothetical protein